MWVTKNSSDRSRGIPDWRLLEGKKKKKFADLEEVQNGSHLSYIIKGALQSVFWVCGQGVPESQIWSGEALIILGSITPYIIQMRSTPSNWSFIKCCLHLDPDMLEVTRCRSLLPIVVYCIGELVLVLIHAAFASSHPLAGISRQSQEIHDLEVPHSLRMAVWGSCSESTSAGSCKRSIC